MGDSPNQGGTSYTARGQRGTGGAFNYQAAGGPFGESGLVGSAFGPVLGSNDPRQYPRMYTQTQPFQNLGPQDQAIQAFLGQRLAAGAPSVGNPYVGPRGEQSEAIGNLQNYMREAGPLYGQSVAQQQRTVGGGYLDPMAQAPFQRLSDARLALARNLFSDFAPQYSSAAVARGVPYSSGSRLAGIQRGGERISTQAAQDIAQAGWQQYGQERQAQEQAARYGTQLAPGLAGQVFNAGEQLRSAEQAGNLAQIEGQLRAAGVAQADIQNALRYMQMASGQALPSLTGPSAQESNIATTGGLTSAFSNLFGGGAGK
jgi:hypothetical protein